MACRRRCEGQARSALLGLVCLVVAACGTSGASGASSKAAAKPAYEVEASTVRGLGSILVDGHGFTLYAYMLDKPGHSTCYGECAVQWPPLLLPGGVARPVAGSGVEATLLGTSRRSDGSLQVTYDNWPVYLYRDDHSPGMVTGQAEDMGAWYVISVNGDIDRSPLPSQKAG